MSVTFFTHEKLFIYRSRNQLRNPNSVALTITKLQCTWQLPALFEEQKDKSHSC